MTTEGPPERAIKSQYISENAWVRARERLAGLETRLDPGTIRYLEALGVGAGWHCLEVGGGGGSIAEWLCNRVEITGHVLATDIDTRFLEALDYRNLEVRRHNILTDELDQEAFDLVHVRTVLFHLAWQERQTALHRMVLALKPGGWLLAEEADGISCVPDPAGEAAAVALFTKWRDAVAAMLESSGGDFYYGRRLYGDLIAHGLVEVGSEGRVSMAQGGTPRAQFYRLGTEQQRHKLNGSGTLSEQEVEDCLQLLDNADFAFLDTTTMAVWGRKPA
jgi:SAM-dependent methyltransferase